MIQVKSVTGRDRSEALLLALKVFMQFEAPEYPEEGIHAFRDFIGDQLMIECLKMYGAYEDDKMVGMIATRRCGNHISLFFVDGNYHRQGIGRRLFNEILKECTTQSITVNAAPYALPIYEHMGFVPMGPEQMTEGIRYTPMRYVREKDSQ